METLNPDFILSDHAVKIHGMYHPWRRLRDEFPDWDVVLVPLRRGLLGRTDIDEQRIDLNRDMLMPQRRCTLDHELDHARAGDRGCQDPKREAQINLASALRLIPMSQLVEAAKWATTPRELAEELVVDLDTLMCRVNHLSSYERAVIRDVIAARDNEGDA